jgi:hypothetical protein
MATAAAIQAITEATLRALKDAARPVGWPEPKLVALRGSEFESRPAELPPSALGVSLYLWRVVPNAAMRNRRTAAAVDGTRLRPPVALDAMYLLSAWGPTAGEQQAVLGWALRALMDVGTLPRGLLNAGTGVPVGAVFGPGEEVELTWEALPTEFAGPLSDLLKPNWPPTVVLAARGVLIESTVPEPADGPLVRARALGVRPWSGEEGMP